MSHNCQSDQAEGLEQSNQPGLCTNGCGFFANPACNNMCSKCYRDSLMAKDRKASNSNAVVRPDVSQLSVSKDVLGPEKTAESPQILGPIPSPAVKEAVEAAVKALPSPLEPRLQEKTEAPASTSTVANPEPPQRAEQKNTGRCFTCNKKVGLTGFKCRCEYVFCGAHRLAEAHDCAFDYKQLGRQRLAESNPLVQASKMEKL